MKKLLLIAALLLAMPLPAQAGGNEHNHYRDGGHCPQDIFASIVACAKVLDPVNKKIRNGQESFNEWWKNLRHARKRYYEKYAFKCSMFGKRFNTEQNTSYEEENRLKGEFRYCPWPQDISRLAGKSLYEKSDGSMKVNDIGDTLLYPAMLAICRYQSWVPRETECVSVYDRHQDFRDFTCNPELKQKIENLPLKHQGHMLETALMCDSLSNHQPPD